MFFRKKQVAMLSIFICILHLVKTSNGLAGPKLTVSNVTENKIHVEWAPISAPNIVIEKYKVAAYPLESYKKVGTLMRNHWTFYNTTFRSDLVGLHPATKYNISVWAITPDEVSDFETKTIWTEVGAPDEPPPVDVIEEKEETITVNIPNGFSNKGPISSYNVVILEKSPIIYFSPEELGDYSQSRDTGIPFYITANLTPEEANETFTVGDRQSYNGYYNAPLLKNKKYEIIVGVVSTLNGVTKVTYSPLQSSIKNQGMFDDDIYRVQTSSPLSVVLSAAIGVFGFLLVLSVIIYFLLRKRYGKRRPSDEMVLRVHGGDGDENGFIPSTLQIGDDTDLDEFYEKLREQYWQIPRNHIEMYATVLGTGQFGEVREGAVRRRSHVVPCIVQTMQAPSLLEKEKRNLLSELDAMSRIGFHTNIVEFLGASDERDVLQVTIEHHQSSLRGLLLRSRQPSGGKVSNLSEPLLLELATGIAQGMAHLADRRIVHRRLTARNILIAEGSVAKIAHFGLGHYNPLGKKYLYTRWTAPEAINMNNYSSRSDIWSFGVLLWEILTLGGSPYIGIAAREILPRVMQGMRLPQPTGVNSEVYQLMLQCWELDREERPQFMDVVSQLRNMFLNARDHVNFQGITDYEYEKFDPSAEDD